MTSGLVDNWQREKSLLECLKYSLQQHAHCDITFQVGTDRKPIQAHKLILTLRSCVFQSMLTGALTDQGGIVIPDIEPDIFHQFLMFLYTDDVIIDGNNVIGLMYVSKKYDVGILERKCLAYLESSVTIDNACVVMEQAHIYEEHGLKQKAMTHICENGDLVLQSPGFTDLCINCILEVTETDELKAAEDKVFEALNGWSEKKCRRMGRETTPENKRSVLGEAIFNVRFSLMDQTYFVNNVSPTMLLTDSEENKIFKNFVCPDKPVLPFRANKRKSALMYTEKDIVIDSAGKAYPNYSRQFGIQNPFLYTDILEFCVNCDCCLRGLNLFNISRSPIPTCSVTVHDKDTDIVIGKSDIISSEMKTIDDHTHLRLSDLIELKSDAVYRVILGCHEPVRAEFRDGTVTGQDGSFVCSFTSDRSRPHRLIASLIFQLR